MTIIDPTELPLAEQLKLQQEANRARFATMPPIQINGLEEHIMLTVVRMLGGQEAVEECLLKWEQQVARHLDGFEAEMRRQQLLQGVRK